MVWNWLHSWTGKGQLKQTLWNGHDWSQKREERNSKNLHLSFFKGRCTKRTTQPCATFILILDLIAFTCLLSVVLFGCCFFFGGGGSYYLILPFVSRHSVSDCKDMSHEWLFMSSQEQTFLQTENYRLISILLYITPTLSTPHPAQLTAQWTPRSSRGHKSITSACPLCHTSAHLRTFCMLLSNLMWGKNRDIDYIDLLSHVRMKGSQYSLHMHYRSAVSDWLPVMGNFVLLLFDFVLLSPSFCLSVCVCVFDCPSKLSSSNWFIVQTLKTAI